jgi:hypothetical protein
MSIFPKKKIDVGNLVIGISKHGWDTKGPAELVRYFDNPSLVLEIIEDKALVYIEHQGPVWYNLGKLERVYVTEEFIDVDSRGLATDKLNRSDQSRNEDDH